MVVVIIMLSSFDVNILFHNIFTTVVLVVVPVVENDKCFVLHLFYVNTNNMHPFCSRKMAGKDSVHISFAGSSSHAIFFPANVNQTFILA